MSTHSKSSLKNPLRKMFPEEWLRETARETGLTKREYEKEAKYHIYITNIQKDFLNA